MSRTFLTIAIALGAFALGIVFGRLALAPGASGDDSAVSARGEHEQSAKGKPSPVSHGTRNVSSRDDGKRSARPDSAGGNGAVSARHLLEQLRRGEQVDFRRMSSLLEKLPPSRERHELVRRLASRWGRDNPEAALAWIDGLTGREQQEALHHALHAWAEQDPAAAARYAAQLPKSERNRHILHEMAHRWAEQDRGAAIAWSLEQPDPATRGTALRGVVHFWAERDPAGAASFAMSLENDYERKQSLEVAARRWAQEDAAGALEWARSLSDDADWRLATMGVLREVAERDPVRAASIYEELTAQQSANDRSLNTRRRLAEEVAGIWSSSSPREAAQWAVGLPEEGEIRRAAVAHAVERWYHLDKESAGQWIQQLPAGNTRDEATSRIVHHTAHTDPATAFSWATQIEDRGHQTGLLHHVLTRWRAADPAAAQTAYEGANLSGDQRRRLGEIFGNESPQPAGAEE